MRLPPIVIEIGESAFAVLADGRELDLGSLEGHAAAPVKIRLDAAVVKRLKGAPKKPARKPRTRRQVQGAALT